MAGDSVVIAGPSGYCIDPDASRATGDGVFVLLRSRASIVRNAKPPQTPGVLTVPVVGYSSSLLSSDVGKTMLDGSYRQDPRRERGQERVGLMPEGC